MQNGRHSKNMPTTSQPPRILAIHNASAGQSGLPAIEFLPLIEDHALAVDIGEWVILSQLACEDLPLLFAGVEHHAWVLAIGKNLNGLQNAPAPLDHHLCHMGVWLHSGDSARNGAHRALAGVESLHWQVHALAHNLCEMRALGSNELALSRLDELRDLRDRLLTQLKLVLHVGH